MAANTVNTPTETPSSDPKQAGIVLATLLVVSAVANLPPAIANVALPAIGRSFDASQTQLNLAAVGYSLGLAMGGRELGVRNVMGLGTAQRNVSATLVVTAQNFAGTQTLPFVLVGAILLLWILLPTAKRLGARAETAPSAAK